MLINLRNALMAGKRTPTARDYVQNGLVAMWDGIENAGWGVHDPTATTWVDLIGNNSLNVRGGSFGDQSWDTTGYTNCTKSGIDFLQDDIKTIKWCVNYPTATVNNWFMAFGGIKRIVAYARANLGGISLWNAKVGFGTWPAGKHSFCSLYGDDDLLGLYIDGAERARGTGSDTWYTPSGSIFIGSLDASRLGFVGSVNNVALYSRILSADEIAANYAIDKARFGLP